MMRYIRLFFILVHIGTFFPSAVLPLWFRFLVRCVRPRKYTSAQRAYMIQKRIIHMGPPFIKLGQFLALRPDVIGCGLAEALSQLHDRVPPFPHEQSLSLIEKAMGQPWQSIFSSIEPSVNAASVAQVHKAYLRKNNQKVAIKVVRPNLKHACKKAFYTLARTIKIAEFFMPKLRSIQLLEALKTLEESLDIEMDMRLEASAIASMIQKNQKNKVCLVTPVVFWDLTTDYCLTTSWIEGTPLRQWLAQRKRVEDFYLSKALARQLMQSFLIQVLENGFFHADLHPGNLFITPTGTLAVVDFGLMGRLSEALRLFLGRVMVGFIKRDYAAVAAVYVEYGYIDGKRLAEFEQALYFIGEPIAGKDSKNISIARLIDSLFQLMCRFHIPLHPELVLLHKTMITVESVAYHLDPDHNFWDTSKPVINTWLEKTFSPKAQIIREFKSVRRTIRGWKKAPDTLQDIRDLLFLQVYKSPSGQWIHRVGYIGLGIVLGLFLSYLFC